MIRKKMLTLFLAGSILLEPLAGPVFSVSAAPDESTVQDLEQTSVPNEDEEPQPEQGDIPEDAVTPYEAEESVDITPAAEEDTGYTAEDVKERLTVKIYSGFAMGKAKKFTASLTGNTIAEEGEIALESGDNNSEGHTFENLSPGVYTLKVSGDGFCDYTQQVTVEEGFDYTVSIYTKMAGGFNGEKQPGVIRFGDFNNDNQSTEADKELLISAIDDWNDGSEISGGMDANEDGSLDLMDLQIFAETYRAEERVSYLEKSVSMDYVQPTVTGVVGEVQGLENLFINDDSAVVSLEAQGNITESNPVTVELNVADNAKAIQGMTIRSPQDTGIASGTVEVEVEGLDQSIIIPITTQEQAQLRLAAEGASASVQADGSILVQFSSTAVAVKKVSIKITGSKGSNNLVEISQVEFLNNMEDRISPPDMSIPENVKSAVGSQEFTISWEAQTNVTGYEVSVRQGNNKEELWKTENTSLKITKYNNNKLKNNTAYTVKVRSINGDWRGDYSDEITVTPKATQKPNKPNNVSVSGGLKSIQITWKDMDNTDSYKVFWKKADQPDSSYQKIENITGTSYTVENLEDDTEYAAYVVGVNEIGDSPASDVAKAATVSVAAVKLPEYNLINTVGKAGEVTAHIKNAARKTGSMKNSSNDIAGSTTALGLVDGDFNSYYEKLDWDEAVYYHRNEWGLTVTLDDKYKMNRFAFVEPVDLGKNWYSGAAVYYLNENGQEVAAQGVTLQQKTDETSGRNYYVIKLASPITTNQVRFGFTTGSGYKSKIQIAEIRFYRYSDIEEKIDDLFADDLHTVLKENVRLETIEALRKEVNTKDSVSGEYHPDKDLLLKELEEAELLLDGGTFGGVIKVSTDITEKKDQHLGFTGLTAWQPLGVSADNGDTLTVYVGSRNQASGANVSLQLVATQYHAEAQDVVMKTYNLKAGKNEITISSGLSTDVDKGGPLYIVYNGNNSTDEYSVRVSGGTRIPVLNLYNVTDEAERKKQAAAYLEEVSEYAEKLEELHKEEQHKKEYDPKTCPLNTTDILIDQMMYTIPVTQVREALKNSGTTTEQKAEALLESLDAMDNMMTLFYQTKGLSDDPNAGAANQLPSQHLTIRYAKMFESAFMYAAGNHIGVQWNETKALVNSKNPVITEDGLLTSGQYFGWGIAHEIGHEIDQSSYEINEITNNYFALLAQSDETNKTVRFDYSDVYEKVTSGTSGMSDNVFTQLAMYWQLHLAYDNFHNNKIFTNYQEQFNNLFYARVDTYARNVSAFNNKKKWDVELKLGAGSEQNFMRLACAASEKNLLEFFERWGLQPDTATRAFAEQFEKEERAVYYMTDDARTYRLTNGEQTGYTNQSVISGADVSYQKDKNTVTLKINGKTDGLHLGYEITRCLIEGGEVKEEVVGFTTDGTFEDVIASLNNRTVFYKITAVDQYTNYSQAYATEQIKLEADGSYEKTGWTVSGNLVSELDKTAEKDDQDPDSGFGSDAAAATESALPMVIDDGYTEEYTGNAESGDAEIIVNFNKKLRIASLSYHTNDIKHAVKDYKISVQSEDNGQWIDVAEGTFSFKDGKATAYFKKEGDGNNLCVYDAVRVKLTAKGQSEISVSELNVQGLTGDNVDFLTAEGAQTIGILADDYVYENATQAKIPKGSLVFIGEYKGNPAYNTVLLFDKSGMNVVGTSGEADQIILADVSGEGTIEDTASGRWVYWIEEGDFDAEVLKGREIRAELYRVNNAQTQEGQRLVSDTLYYKIPDNIPSITISTAAN